MAVRPVCQDGIDLIKKFEGCKLTAYLCPAGVPTIGYGHTGQDVTRQDVVNKKSITQDQADRLLREDLDEVSVQIGRLVKVALSDRQFAALASFTFNLGSGNLGASTLLKKLNAGDMMGAAGEFDKWVMATVNGKRQPLPGLVKRRAAEKVMFLSGTDTDDAMPQAVSSVDAG